MQRQAITDQISQSEALVRGIDEALAFIDNRSQKDMDMKTLFGGFDPALFEDEAKEWWGKTDAWAITAKRTRHYTETDWKRYHSEHNEICAGFAALAARDASPESAEAKNLAKAYADLIDRWFYPCDSAQMTALADMYDNDVWF